MIEILLIVCSTANPAACENRVLPFQGPILTCTMAGQFEVAAWAANHPAWKVDRWKCRIREVRI